MIEEIKISTETGIILIPVGATGFTAYDLWGVVKWEFNNYVSIDSLKTQYRDLVEHTKTPEELIEIIIRIINELIKL